MLKVFWKPPHDGHEPLLPEGTLLIAWPRAAFCDAVGIMKTLVLAIFLGWW